MGNEWLSQSVMTMDTDCVMPLLSMEKMLSQQFAWESNALSYPRNLPLVIKKAHGIMIMDVNGKQYIDALAGAGSLPLGHNHQDMLSSIKSVLDKGAPLHTLDLMTEEKFTFIECLFDSLPCAYRDQVKIQFCGPTGADAVEAAIKLCKTATGREGVISFSGAYHGMTQGTLSLMGNLEPKKDVLGLGGSVQFLPFPYDYRCPFGIGGDESVSIHLNYMEQLLTDPESGVKKPSAIILEVIQGEGGVIVAPDRWLRGVATLAKAHDIPLIVDEVQTGVGRSGYLYAFEKAGIQPDVIVLSKAIGGGLPMSVVIYKKHLDQWQPGAHAGTFRGNVLAMATGLSVIKHVQQKGFLADVRRKGYLLRSKLKALQGKTDIIGDIRGEGLMVGVEIVNPQEPKDRMGHYPFDGARSVAIKKACFSRGLILENGGRFGSVLRFLPPLIITEEQIVQMLAIFHDAIMECSK
ncbi:MAG: diaminobutyrate--2-oxoglutarate transaminase family protein [Cellvibrionales bacterium]|nr:diaminobutyrate--2-oxoglutarate transaminase family protein [Cellvibrionales bacterium]